MPIIESKFLTELYEIRRRINQEIIDLNVEERTAHFRRNAKAALASRNMEIRTVVAPEMEEKRRRAASLGGEGKGISNS